MEITNIEIKNNKNVAHIVLDNDETIQIIGSFLYGNVYHLFLTKIVNDKKVLFSYKTKDFTETIVKSLFLPRVETYWLLSWAFHLSKKYLPNGFAYQIIFVLKRRRADRSYSLLYHLLPF